VDGSTGAEPFAGRPGRRDASVTAAQGRAPGEVRPAGSMIVGDTSSVRERVWPHGSGASRVPDPAGAIGAAFLSDRSGNV